MSEARSLRRVVAEIDAAASQAGGAAIGSRSIHQFWHLFAAEFRGVLLAPRRRPDSGNITWSWREPPDGPPCTAAELAGVRHRLTTANRSLQARAGVLAGDHDEGEGDSLEGQVRLRVGRMAAELIGKSDATLAKFVCRTENGPMLHSWGAPSAARPSFPDLQTGGISGSVLVDGSGIGGVKLTLSAEDSAVTLHTQTGRDGTFRFPSVPPGNYRLRVPERQDFPTAGLSLRMERTAITGLELRNNPVAAADSTQAAGRSARPRHWPAALLVLLIVGGAGTVYWRYARRAPRDASPVKPSADWQTATGKLSATTDASASPETRRSGAAGGWSELSRKLPEPKILDPRFHSRTAPRNRSSEDQRQPENAEALTPKAHTDATASEGAANGGPMSHVETHGDATVGSTPPQISENGSAGEPKTEARQASVDASIFTKATNIPVRLERTVRGKAPAEIPGSSAAAQKVTDGEEKGSSATLHPDTAATSVAPVRAGAESDSDVSGGSPAGSSSGRSASDAGAEVSGGLSTAAGTGSAAEATSHLAARRGNGRHERTGASEGAGTSSLSDGPIATEAAKSDAADAVADLSGEAVAGDSAEETNVAKERNPTDQTNAGMTGEDSSGERAVARAAPAAPAPKSAAKGIAATQPTGQDLTAADQVRAARSEERKLIPLGTIGASAWKTQLVRDAIVPTFPVAEGRNESLDELRRQSLAAERTKLPGEFLAPVTWRGFAVEFSAGSASAKPAWKAGGDVIASVEGNRAELAWPDQNPPADQEYGLAFADGREIARVSIDSRGRATLRAKANVLGWYWLGIEGKHPARGDPEPAARRLEWRLLTGEQLPPTWRPDDNWRHGHGWRIEMPLVPSGRQTDCAVALVDPDSGWALGSEIKFR
jgi:hypothetical protein